MAAYADQNRSDVHPYLPSEIGRLLDVGCFQGAFGRDVKAAHPSAEVWGIEATEDAAEVAAGRLDRVIRGSFPEDVPAGEQFDVVTFLDALEHIADPWAALEAARKMLAPGGRVVASIPNVRHVAFDLLVKGRWEYRDDGIMDRTHLRFFTESTIRRTFDDCGFTIETLDPLTAPAFKSWKRRALMNLLPVADRRGLRTIQYVVVATA